MLFSGNESCILNKSYILPFAFYCGLIFFFVYIWKQLDFFFFFGKYLKYISSGFFVLFCLMFALVIPTMEIHCYGRLLQCILLCPGKGTK